MLVVRKFSRTYQMDVSYINEVAISFILQGILWVMEIFPLSSNFEKFGVKVISSSWSSCELSIIQKCQNQSKP